MKKLFVALLVAISALSIAVSEAQAKRLGGGSSFGRQSSGISRQAPPPSNNQYSNQTSPAPAPAMPQTTPSRPSPWRGILGGALLGLGLGALLSHFGIGGALAGMIGTLLTVALVVAAIMLLMRLFRGKSNEARPAYAGGYTDHGATHMPEIGSRIEPQVQPAAFQNEPLSGGGNSAQHGPYGVPPDFDVQSFLRHAKTYFIRLQAAWDSADINDIREFTTPEMFGELRLQLQERGASPNTTDVVSLDAELLGIEQSDRDYLASVRFSGFIKEEANAAPAPFTEIWNLSKPLSGPGGWVLAGIQQVS